jgi:hypothetical protein
MPDWIRAVSVPRRPRRTFQISMAVPMTMPKLMPKRNEQTPINAVLTAPPWFADLVPPHARRTCGCRHRNAQTDAEFHHQNHDPRTGSRN